VASYITARVLGKSAFGEFGMLQSTANMYMTFAIFGGLTATRYVAEYRQAEPERAGRVLALSIMVAIASGAVVGLSMVASSSWVARLLAAPHLQAAIAICSLVVVLNVINETLNGALSGLEAFKRRSTVQMYTGVASLLLSVLGVALFGLIGAVYALIASGCAQLLLNIHAVHQETSLAGVPLRWQEAKREVAILLSFGLPLIISGVVYVPSAWIANTILVNAPGGYDQMGLFSAADRWRTAILFLPSLLGGVTLPMLANLRSEGDPRRYHNLLFTNIKLSVLASSAVAAPIAALAPWIMASYGPGFEEGRWVLVILATTSVTFAAYWILSQSLVSRGHMWTMSTINLGWAIMLLTSAWLLRGQGAKGLAIAYLVADAGRLIAALVYANRMSLAEGLRGPVLAVSASVRDAS
jgi:O-antigen/teichoic acid export membrane protein